jgi:succinate dehydrogenase / fumarate reductase, membrane anchor subunit
MAMSVSSLGRNGVHDYILVRASALVLAAYGIFLLAYIFSMQQIAYQDWIGLFKHPLMKIGTLLALLSLLVHAWIGTWQVLTDYVKPPRLRSLLQFVCILILFVYVALGNMIIWSV